MQYEKELIFALLKFKVWHQNSIRPVCIRTILSLLNRNKNVDHQNSPLPRIPWQSSGKDSVLSFHGPGSIPSRGAKILQASRRSQKDRPLPNSISTLNQQHWVSPEHTEKCKYSTCLPEPTSRWWVSCAQSEPFLHVSTERRTGNTKFCYYPYFTSKKTETQEG